MIFTQTKLQGAFIIDIERREDSRGFFARAFCQNEFTQHGLKPVSNMVKDSDGPPDFWASAYPPARIGTYPLSTFPADGEEFAP